jgi:Fe-S cluster assembly iron-binding protein IscA
MIAETTNRLRVSDRARSRILGILEERRKEDREDGLEADRKPGLSVRLFAEIPSTHAPDEISRRIELALAIDERRPGDESFADEALPLVADGESLRALEGLILDYEESMAFHGFTLSRHRSCVPPDFAE